jgi:hypothetical protein
MQIVPKDIGPMILNTSVSVGMEDHMSGFPRSADILGVSRLALKVPCVDGAPLARVFLTGDAELVGAAMCSTC